MLALQPGPSTLARDRVLAARLIPPWTFCPPAVDWPVYPTVVDTVLFVLTAQSSSYLRS